MSSSLLSPCADSAIAVPSLQVGHSCQSDRSESRVVDGLGASPRPRGTDDAPDRNLNRTQGTATSVPSEPASAAASPWSRAGCWKSLADPRQSGRSRLEFVIRRWQTGHGIAELRKRLSGRPRATWPILSPNLTPVLLEQVVERDGPRRAQDADRRARLGFEFCAPYASAEASTARNWTWADSTMRGVYVRSTRVSLGWRHGSNISHTTRNTRVLTSDITTPNILSRKELVVL